MARQEEEGEAPGSAGGVMAIRLVLEVLELLATRSSVGVTELARELGTTKPRVFRHLRTLVDRGYAVQNAHDDRYEAGPRLIALSRAAAVTPDGSIIRLARPLLARLRDSIGFTVNLSLVYGDTVSIVETVPGRGLIDVTMRTYQNMPLHATAAGKLLIADRLDRGDDSLLAGPFETFTVNTITDPDALRREVLRAGSQGWADAPEEVVLGINALSAPVRDHRGDLVAMVSIMGSIQFIPRHPPRSIVDAICGTADAISKALSF